MQFKSLRYIDTEIGTQRHRKEGIGDAWGWPVSCGGKIQADDDDDDYNCIRVPQVI